MLSGLYATRYEPLYCKKLEGSVVCKSGLFK